MHAIVAQITPNALFPPFSRPGADTGITPNKPNTANTKGMDDMFTAPKKADASTRRIAETSGATDGGRTTPVHGVMAGTKVASNLGMKAVEEVKVGDKVLTLDHGMQIVTEVRSHAFWVNTRSTRLALLPVHVPVGALGNRAPLTLRADQGVEVESDALADVFGQSSFIIPARALIGQRGIRHEAPDGRVEMITLCFAQDEVIYAEAGAAIHCPTSDKTATNMLSLEDAALVAECLAIEDSLEMDAKAAVA